MQLEYTSRRRSKRFLFQARKKNQNGTLRGHGTLRGQNGDFEKSFRGTLRGHRGTLRGQNDDFPKSFCPLKVPSTVFRLKLAIGVFEAVEVF